VTGGHADKTTPMIADPINQTCDRDRDSARWPILTETTEPEPVATAMLPVLRCDGTGAHCSHCRRDGAAVPLTATDIGSTIEAQETASNAGGPSQPASSTATASSACTSSDAGGDQAAVTSKPVQFDGSNRAIGRDQRPTSGLRRRTSAAGATITHTYTAPGRTSRR